MQSKSLWGDYLTQYYKIQKSTDAQGENRIQNYNEFEKNYYEQQPVEAEEPVIPEEFNFLNNEVNTSKSKTDVVNNESEIDEVNTNESEDGSNLANNDLDEISESELEEFKALNGISDKDIVVEQPTETKVKSVKVSKPAKTEKKSTKAEKTEKKPTKGGKRNKK